MPKTNVVANIIQLASIKGIEDDVAVVTQLHRGGVFIYRMSYSLPDDDGTVFSSSGTGKWVRQARELGEPFNVWWFGALPDGAIDYKASAALGTDNTRAFNAALLASTAYDAAVLNTHIMKREVYIPAGNYRINGTIYVRKGQHLRGAGYGATRLMNTTGHTEEGVIYIGHGINGAQDPGGTPAQISNFMIDGTAKNRVAIKSVDAAGTLITDLWVLNAWRGFSLGGSDVIMTDCVFDQCMFLGTVNNFSITISNCIFFRVGSGLDLPGGNTPPQSVNISHCRWEFYRENDLAGNIGGKDRYMINFPRGESPRQVLIESCQFTLKDKNPDSRAMVRIGCFKGLDIVIRNCQFNNMQGYAISHTGFNNEILVDGCTFNGTPTLSTYVRTDNQMGLYLANQPERGAESLPMSIYTVRNCQFLHLSGAGITVGGSHKYRLMAIGNIFEKLANTSAAISVTADVEGAYVLSMNNVLVKMTTSVVMAGTDTVKNVVNDVYI